MISAAVAALCQAIPSETTQVTTYYNKLTAAVSAYPNAQKYFSHTLAYINNPTAKSAFLAGGTTCDEFFVGLKAAFVADLQSDRLPALAIEVSALQYIDKLIAAVKG